MDLITNLLNDFKNQFESLGKAIENFNDDNPQFLFIDRLAKNIQEKCGWNEEDSINFAMAVKYEVSPSVTDNPLYLELEQLFFDLLVKVIDMFEKRYPSCIKNKQGLMAIASTMQYEIKC